VIGNPYPSAQTSSIHAEPTSVSADGTSRVKLTITVERIDGSPIQSMPVSLSSTGGGNKFIVTDNMTDSQGIVIAEMTSTSAESKTVTASFGNVSVNTQVNFQLCHGALFLPAVPYDVGRVSHAVLVGDFNMDGKLDLAVPNQFDQDVSVLLGTGNGSFSPKINYLAGDDPRDLAMGDFNKDGIPDLVVTHGSPGAVTTLLGKDSGVFDYPLYSVVDGGAAAVVANDFDGKGTLGVAVLSYTDRAFNVMSGTGSGSFSLSQVYYTNYGFGAMAAGYFDTNHQLDLVFTNSSYDNVSVYLAATDGTFPNANSYTIKSASAIAVGDFDGKNGPDLAISGYNTVSILLNDGHGMFGTSHDYAAGDIVGPMAVGDFNADGRLDIATTLGTGGDVGIVLGGGDGTLGQALHYSTGHFATAIRSGDFDGDGRSDLAVLTDGDTVNQVSILLRSGCVP